MAKTADKFVKLKTSIGGNREKTGFEYTFGTPMEEQAHITRPNRANHRIISELEFALRLSEEQQGCFGKKTSPNQESRFLLRNCEGDMPHSFLKKI